MRLGKMTFAKKQLELRALQSIVLARRTAKHTSPTQVFAIVI